MRALIVKNQRMVFAQYEEPEPNTDELIIEVAAVGVNRADLMQKEGRYPPPPGASPLLGLEVAGIVERTGSPFSPFRRGDRVMALLSGGGYAERVCVHQDHVLPIPSRLTFEEAAAIPEAFLTAYQALFLIGELQPEQWVLIHAGGSGVGTAAIQLTHAAGAYPIATTRSEQKIESCLEIGAHAVIHPYQDSFSDQVSQITSGHGADLILDFIGAPYYEENIDTLAYGGALIFLSTLGGAAAQLDIQSLFSKWATLSATTLRNRPAQYKGKLIREFARFALERFERGELFPVLYANLPWSEVEEAHHLLDTNQVFGKITLSIY